jgi:hypothetical protein
MKKPEGFRVNSRCFSLFFQKFTASGTSCAAEILGFRRFDQKNNSERPAVLSLFPAVLGKRVKSEIISILTLLRGSRSDILPLRSAERYRNNKRLSIK